ncbi:TusE/DsrC/DsvC family sulfur relay protein [Pantoea sp. Aalb]|uniref:TusE/DsrC/DsvC family sulfur relay protein n=1 Tax=Pantoea sp. Aalb TaxID=2576762 RepID=UPI001325FE1B|nr:TusE/DsrC/DsvC family sulfur relay protein [Pantoea sp. Aalb]MXP67477.1 TusE/DsrC/DsvC family sulfur relay protein [Pantoea sp. Aalb]
MKFNGKDIATDQEGYLKNFTDWNESLARCIAAQELIVMNESHWEVIYFIRQFYKEFNISPTVRMLVKFMGQKHGKKSNSRYLFQLFPEGPVKQATRIAGLPKPINCL